MNFHYGTTWGAVAVVVFWTSYGAWQIIKVRRQKK
jgi:hypothetical protein